MVFITSFARSVREKSELEITPQRRVNIHFSRTQKSFLGKMFFQKRSRASVEVGFGLILQLEIFSP
jgi:hypothetical protein